MIEIPCRQFDEFVHNLRCHFEGSVSANVSQVLEWFQVANHFLCDRTQCNPETFSVAHSVDAILIQKPKRNARIQSCAVASSCADLAEEAAQCQPLLAVVLHSQNYAKVCAVDSTGPNYKVVKSNTPLAVQTSVGFISMGL
jgi:hypothetical protein